MPRLDSTLPVYLAKKIKWVLVSLLFVLLSLSQVWAGIVSSSPYRLSSEVLESEIQSRLMRVEEFRYLRDHAAKLGLRVWLFGGTAAGFGHYVVWDLLRELGDSRLQKDRFDYDFTNIYRSTQDLDVVVDGTPAQAEELEHLLQEKFPHLQGAKSAWEVRLLRQEHRGKEALFNNKDFLEQHTDSNSTGMIEVSAPPNGDHIVKDFRQWDSARPYFFNDLLNGQLHYYFSPTHHQTSRALKNLNPPILSAIRYLTKAFQYELDLQPQELEVISHIINEWNPSTPVDSYVRGWIEKNAKKLFHNASNIEYAWNTLEQLGLRQKLIQFGGNPNKSESMAWWMNKEPLRSFRLGEMEPNDRRHQIMPNLNPWKTAAELGLNVVAHETRTFLAYESITRSHLGSPNVLISRNYIPGEAAVHGNGFYTRRGMAGAVGTGITIRFKVKPEAREGVDFTTAGDYVIFLNKNALEVIPEQIQMSPLQYFKTLKEGLDFSRNDLGILEKFKRRIRHRAKTIPQEQISEINALMDEQALGNFILVREFLDILPEQLTQKQATFILTRNIWQDLNTQIFALPQISLTPLEYLKHLKDGYRFNNRAPQFPMLMDKLRGQISKSKSTEVESLHRFIQAIPEDQFDRQSTVIGEYIDLLDGRLSETFANKLLLANSPTLFTKLMSYPVWVKYAFEQGIIEKYVYLDHIDINIWKNMFLNNSSEWLDDYAGTGKLIYQIAKKSNAFSATVAQDFLTQKKWRQIPDISLVLDVLIKNLNAEAFVDFKQNVLTTPELVHLTSKIEEQINVRLVKDYLEGRTQNLEKAILFAPQSIELIEQRISIKDDNYHYIAMQFFDAKVLEILSDPQFAAQPKAFDILLALIKKPRNFDDARSKFINQLLSKVLAQSHWLSHPQIDTLMEATLDLYETNSLSWLHGGEQSKVFIDILTRDQWIQNPKSIEYILRVIKKHYPHGTLVSKFLSKPQWTKVKGSFDVLDVAAKNKFFSGPNPIQMIEADELSAKVFSMPEWANRSEVYSMVEDCIDGALLYAKHLGQGFHNSTHAFKPIYNILLSNVWMKDPRWPQLVRKAMAFEDGNYLLARHVFSNPQVANHPMGAELLLELIHQRRAEGDIVNYVLNEPAWALNPKATEIITELKKLGTITDSMNRILTEKPHWSNAHACAISLESRE